MGLGVRQKLRLIQRLDERDRLHWLAEAGVKQAAVQIRKARERVADSFQDTCANAPDLFKDMDIGGGRVDIHYTLRDERSGEESRVYGLIDEARKINVNTAEREVLERLFKIVLDADEMQAQDLAASLVDWRDQDSQLTIPVGSAEDPFYRNLEHPYEAKDMNFEVLDELLFLKGMSREALARLRDYLTVYGDGFINANTASPAVLMSLGMNERLADKILSYRLGKDSIGGTEDDNIFNSQTGIVSKLSQFSSLSDSEVADLTRIADQFLTVRSDNFMVQVTARLKGRQTGTEVTAVINRSGDILYWNEL